VTKFLIEEKFMKKIMLLGGSRYLIPVIEAAHELGLYVITCDYLPDNVAHKFSDKYLNISIIDKEAVLHAAKEEKIDGIMSFACDPGVVTAAYVAEQMGLPSAGPYESVCILQDKGKFRNFLKENGFNVPYAKSYICVDEANKDVDKFKWPVIVKPVDSAGSKGVTRVETPNLLENAICHALEFSHSGRFIIEEFIEKKGCSSDSDCFSIDGKLVTMTFSSQRFDPAADNPYAPMAFSWPSTFSQEHEKELTDEIQRLLNLLNLSSSIYNIETREGVDGKAYIMEVSPRGGGNRLAEMVKYATGEDMIMASVKAAVGDTSYNLRQAVYNGCWAEYIIHSEKRGIFKELHIDNDLKDNVKEVDLWIKQGETVHEFSSANFSLGTIVLHFDSQAELESVMKDIDKKIRVVL
jgi:biotin carboxylase